MPRATEENIKSKLRIFGFEFVSLDHPFHTYKCNCGNVVTAKTENLYRLKKCAKCWKEKKIESFKAVMNTSDAKQKRHDAYLMKYNNEYIKSKLKVFGFEFVSLDHPFHTYKCNCGNVVTAKTENLYRLKKCSKCWKQKNIERLKTAMNTPEMIQKTRETCLRKYGVDNAMKCEEIKEKAAQTNLVVYGNRSACSTEEVRSKIKKTNMERYGYENCMSNEQIRKKQKTSMIEKYGDHPMKSIVIREKCKNTFIRNYGVDHPMKSIEIKEKLQKTNLERYGFKSVFENKLIQSKIMTTIIKKYGCNYVSQNTEIKKKIQKTNLERYGFYFATRNTEIMKKIQKTNLERYGFKCSLENANVKLKIIQTNMKRYGVHNPMQNPSILEKQFKSAYSRKLYKFPSGRIRFLQGYEPFCADDLLHKENIQEHDIVCGAVSVPIIDYQFKGKQHRYFPDFFIPSKNLIIEVKSTWTIQLTPEKNKAKFEACQLAGYNIEIRIYSPNKTFNVL